MSNRGRRLSPPTQQPQGNIQSFPLCLQNSRGAGDSVPVNCRRTKVFVPAVAYLLKAKFHFMLNQDTHGGTKMITPSFSMTILSAQGWSIFGYRRWSNFDCHSDRNTLPPKELGVRAFIELHQTIERGSPRERIHDKPQNDGARFDIHLRRRETVDRLAPGPDRLQRL
jgi:hypothetical protein